MHASVAPVTVVPRKRRGVELALIIFALGLTLGAYALVDLNVTGELSPTFPYLAGVCRPARGAGAPRGPVATPVRRSGDPALRDLAQRPRAWS